MRNILGLIFLFVWFSNSFSQSDLTQVINITKINHPIVIDGHLDSSEWGGQSILTHFIQNFPSDTAEAFNQTEIKICFDETNLYISARCFQENRFTAQSLKQDFENGSTDIFAIIMDPFGDHQNGFFFGVNPYGVMKEGQIFASNELNIDWNNKWRSKVTHHGDWWDVEMAIPFKSLRYKLHGDKNIWQVNFLRNNVTFNERSSWVNVPRIYKMTNLQYTAPMIWAEAPPTPGSNVILIPYVLTESTKNFIDVQKKNKLNAGLDAKIGITPSLNLDLSINPDFAQVEVDRQVTDLSRFEILFPERRQFFIENNDLFGSFGASRIQPFFSRRIGIAVNPLTGINEKIPITAGLRLSGKLNDDWRIGIMSLQTEAQKRDSLPSINYSVVSVQRKIFDRSNLSAILVNKQARINQFTRNEFNSFNRLGGFEFNYLSKNSEWSGKIFGLHSFSANKSNNKAYSAGTSLTLDSRRFLGEFNFYHVGENFEAEVGYVPRKNYIQMPASLNYRFFPKGKLAKWINSFQLGPDYDIYYGLGDQRTTDWDAGIFYRILFSDGSSLNGSLLRWDYTFLFEDFDPTNKYEAGFNILKAGTNYTYFSNRISFNSTPRNKTTLSLQAKAGAYFNGRIASVSSSLGYRLQPYGIINLELNYNRLRFPNGYNKADFWILGPRMEWTFTKNLFWTSFFQYNNQINNFNINSRFQWRFKPLSDLFIVYTDNYFAQNELNGAYQKLDRKNRALVIKLNYWLNL